jgi:F-type H+-transporting ATPase subunit b
MLRLLYLPLTAAPAPGEPPKEPATSHNPILPETNELVYSIIAFAVLVLLFLKYAYPAVQKGMEARTQRIREDLEKADKAKTDAESALADYKKQLSNAKAEADKIMDEARKQAEKVKADLIARANDEAAEIKSKASADIESARSAALASLQSSVAEIAIELAEKVVEKNLDRETNKRLIDGFIAQVGS